MSPGLVLGVIAVGIGVGIVVAELVVGSGPRGEVCECMYVCMYGERTWAVRVDWSVYGSADY